MTKKAENEVAVRQEMTPAQVQELFPVLGNDAGEIREAIADNFPDGISFNDLPRASILGGGAAQWELGDGTTVPELEGVIVWHTEHRQFWSKPIEDGGGERPDCFSDDGEFGVGTPGGTCATCPLARFGPAGERPACRQRKVLYMIRSGDFLPTVINLSPTNLKPIRQYLRQLVARAKSYWKVVTRLGLQREKGDGVQYSTVVPQVAEGGVLTPGAVSMVRAYREAAMGSLAKANVAAATRGDTPTANPAPIEPGAYDDGADGTPF